MQQALHILRKDIRCLSYEILVCLAITSGLVWAHLSGGVQGEVFYSSAMLTVLLASISFLLPVSWWYLTSRLVH